MDRQTSRPCPSCGKHMQLKRIIAGLGGSPQIYVYICHFCGVSLSEAEEPDQHRPIGSTPTSS